MPNWCQNAFTISGSEEIVKKLAKAFEDNKFLQTLRPEPEYEKDDEWYDWRITNWGTKWEAEGSEVDVELSDKYYFEGYFNSAWGPPTEAYKYAVKNMKGLSIVAYYYESGEYFAGSFEGYFDEELDEAQIVDEGFYLSYIEDEYKYFTTDSLGITLEENFGILEYMIECICDEAGEFNIVIIQED